MAFFARTVLLVEGTSDEIIVAGPFHLNRSLPGAAAQIVPVLGKGDMPETAKLFRLMGKRVVILADLDAFADGPALINSSAAQPEPRYAAINYGYDTVIQMDKLVRSALMQAITSRWDEIAPLAAQHHYMTDRRTDGTIVEENKRWSRAGLAALLTVEVASLQALRHGDDWINLRQRTEALFSVLEKGGCFFLRCGTIEDCYLARPKSGLKGKPEAAAEQVAAFMEVGEKDLRHSYADVLRAIEYAAPKPPVTEGDFLRQLLGGLLGMAFQFMEENTTDGELTELAAANHPAAARIFGLKNATVPGRELSLLVEVTSQLFEHATFPVLISKTSNLHAEVGKLFREENGA